MTKNGNTTTWRLTQLEKQVDGLDGKVCDLLENHIPHLQEEVTSLKTRITVLTAINIGAIILGLIFAKVL
jgi:peptidoglycan hydrolase CwlO-like protein